MGTPLRTIPIIKPRDLDPEGMTPGLLFAQIVGGDSKTSIVLNALSVASRVYEQDAAEFRGIATAIACDGEQVPFMTLRGACNLAEQFDRQAKDARAMHRLLNDSTDDEE